MTRTILVFDADVVMLQLGRWVAAAAIYRFLRGKINAPWADRSMLQSCCGCRWRCTWSADCCSCAKRQRWPLCAALFRHGHQRDPADMRRTNDKADLVSPAPCCLARLGACTPCGAAAAAWWGVLLCGGCLCLAMGLYQGYIEFAIGLLPALPAAGLPDGRISPWAELSAPWASPPLRLRCCWAAYCLLLCR